MIMLTPDDRLPAMYEVATIFFVFLQIYPSITERFNQCPFEQDHRFCRVLFPGWGETFYDPGSEHGVREINKINFDIYSMPDMYEPSSELKDRIDWVNRNRRSGNRFLLCPCLVYGFSYVVEMTYKKLWSYQ